MASSGQACEGRFRQEGTREHTWSNAEDSSSRDHQDASPALKGDGGAGGGSLASRTEKRLCQQKTTGALEVNCGLRHAILMGVDKKSPIPSFLVSSIERPTNFLVLMSFSSFHESSSPMLQQRSARRTDCPFLV